MDYEKKDVNSIGNIMYTNECEQCKERIRHTMICQYCKMVLCSECYNEFHPCNRIDIDVVASINRIDRVLNGRRKWEYRGH